MLRVIHSWKLTTIGARNHLKAPSCREPKRERISAGKTDNELAVLVSQFSFTHNIEALIGEGLAIKP